MRFITGEYRPVPMKTCSNLVKNSNVVNINMYHPLLLLIIAVLLAASAGVRPLLRSAAASPGSFPVVPSDLVSRDPACLRPCRI